MTYLLAVDNDFGTDEEVEAILDSIEAIDDWRSDLPRAYYVRSPKEASWISDEIKRRCPPDARFIVSEITDNSDGFVSPETWDFVLEDPARMNLV